VEKNQAQGMTMREKVYLINKQDEIRNLFKGIQIIMIIAVTKIKV
jgi:hypothetical protein